MKQPNIFLPTALLWGAFFISSSIQAQIPDSLQFDWQKAGLDADFVEPTNIIDLTTYGAIPNDGIDDTPALQAAFSSLGSNGAIIQLPNGTLNFSSSINMPSNCILRGAGSDSTLLDFNLNNQVANCINFWGSASGTWFPLQGALSRDSLAIRVSGNFSNVLLPGKRIEIRQQNGAWDTNPATWANGSVGHITTIDSVKGDTIFMREPLRTSLDTLLNPEVRVINCVENSGLECVKIIRTDSTAASVNFAIYTYFAYNCRIRGVESFKSIGAHFLAEISSHIEVSGCYFHEAYGYTGSNTRGYGAVVGVHATLCKIENNIFRKLRHSMMVKQGANGNVFAYNYSIEPNRSEFPANYGADICVHGHYPFANLFEGNICQNIIIDQAWGPNGPNNAYFRNRAELYGLLISSGTVQSDRQTIVGNDITSTALFQGQYSLNGIGHYQASNRVQGNVTPAGTTSLTDTSLFLSQAPVYWGNMPWPGIGLPFTSTANAIPASMRYNSIGSKTICGDPDSLFSSMPSVLDATSSIPFNPYYVNGVLHFGSLDFSAPCNVQVIDLSGRLALNQDISAEVLRNGCFIGLNWAPGVYLVQLRSAEGSRVGRMLVPAH